LRSSFWLDPWFLLMRRSIIAAITVTITTDKFQQFVKDPGLVPGLSFRVWRVLPAISIFPREC
jgi:hypothetical protein